MSSDLFDAVYTPETRKHIQSLIEIEDEVVDLTTMPADDQVEVLLGGWGMQELTEEVLDKLPNLKVIFYAAGTMKGIVTDGVWKRGIRITTANQANAQPVAEFALGQILIGMKNTYALARQVKENQGYLIGPMRDDITGLYQTTVGITSLSAIGKQVIQLLKPFDVNIQVYDPYGTEEVADQLGVSLVSLETLFASSDVVTIHTPLLPDTEKMVNKDLLASMKQNTTLINTARGGLIDEEALVAVLKDRTDLTAVLDVTNPEPPENGSVMYDLDNIVLTPHIAGSAGAERKRLGDAMAGEIAQYLEKDQLSFEVTEDMFNKMA
uniref:hydroxyacid dehydrogenase n=1 Tax=Aerococcus urinaeequi TaxID=51665 RepID=UPI00352B8483